MISSNDLVSSEMALTSLEWKEKMYSFCLPNGKICDNVSFSVLIKLYLKKIIYTITIQTCIIDI